jgi:hypothetical protein
MSPSSGVSNRFHLLLSANTGATKSVNRAPHGREKSFRRSQVASAIGLAQALNRADHRLRKLKDQ